MGNNAKYKINRVKLLRAVLIIIVLTALVFIGIFLKDSVLNNQNSISISPDIINSAPPESLVQHGIIIDAGHGGSDPGAISTITGIKEAKLNLDISLLLAGRLEQMGIPVILTRADENAVAGTKDADMEKRRNIIHASNAALMVSIHMNSFPDNPDVHGAQVHFQDGSASSKRLALSMQSALSSMLGSTRNIQADNLYVLNGNPMPSVLIECGFLTNDSEARLLEQASYQEKLVTALIVGLFAFQP